MAFWCLCATLLLAIPCGARMVGGPMEQSPDSPLVMDAAHVALTLYNEQANDKYFYTLGKVISAKTQVVAGVIFYLEVAVGRCEKQDQHMTSCPQDSNTKMLLCDFSLWEQPWENSKKLLKSQCRDA